MASIQKSVDACKTTHHDSNQLDNVKSVLMDCTQRLINTDKSRKEIAKSTKLCSEVLDVVAEETQAGLKALAPSHSFAAVMKRSEVEKRRELAEKTGAVMSEKDQTKNMQEFLKRKKSSAGKNTGATSNCSSSVVSPSPKKKARRSERQKPTQNDDCPHFPDNGKMFSPVELCNMLLPLEGKKRLALVDHFSEKNWLRYEGGFESAGKHRPGSPCCNSLLRHA